MDTTSENKPSTVKYTYVPTDAMISIEVSGTYLKRCSGFLLQLSQFMGEEKLQAALKKLSGNDKPESIEELALFVILPLVDSIEKAAIKQNKTMDVELTPEQAAQIFEDTVSGSSFQ